MATERVQKILAQTGLASRRQAEELIREGRVTINGKQAQLGDKADLEKDSIKVDGKLLRQGDKEAHVYVAFNKPRAVISMFGDPQGRESLADYLSSIKARLFPIGRLDYLSEGLVLLTNDGELAEKIQKSDEIARVYWVRVKGHPDREMLSRLAKGGRIEGKMVKPHSVRLAEDMKSRSKIEVVLVGPTGDIQGLMEQKGFLTDKLVRVSIGQIGLEELQPGQFRLLRKSQFEALVNQPELGLKRIEEIAEKEQERLDRAQQRRMEKAEAEGAGEAESAPRKKVIAPRPADVRKGGVIRRPGGAYRRQAEDQERADRAQREPYGERSGSRGRSVGGYGKHEDRPARSGRPGNFGGKRSGGFGEKRSAGPHAPRFGGGGASGRGKPSGPGRGKPPRR